MATSSTERAGSGADWLGLGEASRALGVNESTLRRWADAGFVRTFRTPGGHRRFSSDDLRRLMNVPLAARRKFDGEALHRIRQRLEQDVSGPPAWLAAMAPRFRDPLAELGRETVALAERYLDPAADGGALEAATADIGQRYAQVLRRAEVSLTEAMVAFAYFRRGMEEALRAFAEAHSLTATTAADLWERVSGFEDRILIALTGTYELQSAEEGERPSERTQERSRG